MGKSETAYFMYTLRWLKECENELARKERVGQEKGAPVDNISAIYHMAYYDMWNRLIWTYGTDFVNVLESYVYNKTMVNSLGNAYTYASKLEQLHK